MSAAKTVSTSRFVAVCLSSLATKRSVCGPREVRSSDQRSRFAWSQTSRTSLKRKAHARESCARMAAGPRQSRSACSGIPLPKDAGPGASSGWRSLLSSRRWLPPLLSASRARLTRPLVGDGQVGELWRAGEYVCHRRLHGLQSFLAARVPLARTRFLLAFEHGQDVGLGRVHLVPHEHLPHQARAGLLGGP